MNDEQAPVVYKAGQAINVHRPLQVENLAKERWGPIAAMYPEIATLLGGSPATFFGKPNTTIFPVMMVSASLLKSLSRSQEPPKRWVYTFTSHDKLQSVLVHVVGGYDCVYIYRLYRRPARRLRRR
jgi:hypothetical protein